MELQTLSDGIFRIPGSVWGGLLVRDGHALLIDLPELPASDPAPPRTQRRTAAVGSRPPAGGRNAGRSLAPGTGRAGLEYQSRKVSPV